MKIKPVNCTMFSLGSRLYISIFSVLTCAVLMMSSNFSYILLLLLTVLFHELSHVAFLHLSGAKIKKITIFPFGIDIKADTGKISYKNELICTLSGSFCNLVIGFICFIFMQAYPSPKLLFFLVCNATLGLFNLLPLPYLDGGNALRLFLYDRLEIDKAYTFAKKLDEISVFLFALACFIIVQKTSFNLSIAAVGIYGTLSYLAKRVLSQRKEKAV